MTLEDRAKLDDKNRSFDVTEDSSRGGDDQALVRADITLHGTVDPNLLARQCALDEPVFAEDDSASGISDDFAHEAAMDAALMIQNDLAVKFSADGDQVCFGFNHTVFISRRGVGFYNYSSGCADSIFPLGSPFAGAGSARGVSGDSASDFSVATGVFGAGRA